MHRIFPLLLSGVLLLLPGRASLAEPPKEHEEWQGSVGALWIQYPLSCAVWGDEEKRIFQCKQEDNTVDLTIRRSPAVPLLRAQGTILGKTVDVHAVKKGNILEISGAYDTQKSTLPLSTAGTAQDFTFSGIYDNTPFQGKGSYKPDSLHVSLSFTKTFPITGTLDLRRNDGASSSLSGLAEFSSSTGTGMTLTATEMIPTANGNTPELNPPALPLLSSGTIEGATQKVVERVQDTGQALMGFSRLLSLVFQSIFAVLVILVLITFGFLFHHLKKQKPSPPPGSPPSPRAPTHDRNFLG